MFVVVCRNQGLVSSSLCVSQSGEFSKFSICSQSPVAGVPLLPRVRRLLSCRYPSSSTIEG
ncbi:hypothetical protein AHAS_Ahas15G0360200 [Arachis hypogaea]